MSLCCVIDCCLPIKAKGLCQSHYVRMRRGADLSSPMKRSGTDEQRLMRKTRMNAATGCWEWIASLNTNGYGQFRINGTTEQAHRAAWMIFKGPIPKNNSVYGTMNVLHHCDNPLCVNPYHLFLGDQSDNATDAVSKNRWGKRGCKGATHGRTILTDAMVREIRKSSQSPTELAVAYHVSVPSIYKILSRRTWKHII